MISLAVVTVCGNFIGIAFQTEVYYTCALATMLAAYVRRAKAIASYRRIAEISGDGLMREPAYG
jgi:hypothetical protein